MIYTPSLTAVVIFIIFVAAVVGISLFLGKQTGSSKGFFAAGGTIHWGVNGIAFAGDYLSAASFLGICGMIAVAGYDGFLYSIGYLAGWVVALFVVAEPMKRLGRYTFTDALDSRFNSKGIQLMAGISTLIVSLCYLIPQMVGAGVLVQPLLGFPHWAGVVIVGIIVIFIVATAGMKSTTYVQFLKGGLLIIFSLVISIVVVFKGISNPPSEDYHKFEKVAVSIENGEITVASEYTLEGQYADKKSGKEFYKLRKDNISRWYTLEKEEDSVYLIDTLSMTELGTGEVLYNGEPKETRHFYQVGHVKKIVLDGKVVTNTGPLSPAKYLTVLQDSEIVLFEKLSFSDGDNKVSLWYQKPTPGEDIMRPGIKFKVDEKKGADFWSRLNFVSLMLALFFGTSALPHVLIRYYTVPSASAARKSTIVAIGAIGFFYILTIFMGTGAMVNGVLDVNSNNMSAPLLAKFIGTFLFSMVSALAFATVLGTVSGLIIASSGAVAHDIMKNFLGIEMSDTGQVAAGKISAVIVGIVAILLGIIFKGMNVSYLVGLAFAVAASANLPSILMLLFWKKTTKRGIAASVFVGMVSALIIILLSPSMFERYGLPGGAPIPLDNPGVISIPLSFLTLIVVSLFTQNKKEA